MPKNSKYAGVYNRDGSPWYWGKVTIKHQPYFNCYQTTNKAEAARQHRVWRAEMREGLRRKGNIMWMGFRTEFLRHLQHDLASKTVSGHEKAIEYLESFFKPRLLHEIEPKVLVGLQEHMRDKNIAGPSGRNKVMICLKAMMHWAEKMEYIPPRSWAAISMEREEAHSDRYSPDEISQMYSGCENMHHRTIVLLGAHAGLRPCEMRDQKRKDIDLKTRIMRIFSPKTKTWRDIPLTQKLVEHLAEYMSAFPAKDGYLLHNKYGERYSSNALGQAFKKIVKRAEVRIGSPYMLRHSFVTMLKEAGVDHFTAGKLAGHKKPLTTRIYDHISTDRLQDAIRKLPAVTTPKKSPKL